MSLTTPYNDPGKLENLILQWLKPWAFNVYGNSVFCDRGNVAFIKQKLSEAGFPDIHVRQRS